MFEVDIARRKRPFPVAQTCIVCLMVVSALVGCPSPTSSGPDDGPAALPEVADLQAAGVVESVVLTWTDPAGADYNRILVTWTPEGITATEVTKGTERFAATGLANGTEYTFTVRTADSDGNQSSGVTATATPSAANPAVPPVAQISRSPEGDVVVGEPVSFDGSGSSDPDGEIVAYAWDFGDGATSTDESPQHTYTTAGSFIVSLTVTDDDDNTNEASIALEANVVVAGNESPVAAMLYTPEIPNIGETVEFNGTESDDTDGTIDSYEWSFGDGTTATGVDVSHDYSSSGAFTVRLIVTDDEGATDIATEEIYVNVPPTADAGDDQSVNPNDEAVISLAGSASDPDGTIVSYSWRFTHLPPNSGLSTSDIADADTAQPSFSVEDEEFWSYPEDDWTYAVELTVTDNNGAVATDEVTIEMLGATDVEIQ
ncbi:MAG: PKD domain-containing protein [Spirochaetota bacterium]